MVELEKHVSSRPASSTGSIGPYRPNRIVPSFEGVAVHEPKADNEARIAACRWLKELEKGNTPGIHRSGGAQGVRKPEDGSQEQQRTLVP